MPGRRRGVAARGFPARIRRSMQYLFDTTIQTHHSWTDQEFGRLRAAVRHFYADPLAQDLGRVFPEHPAYGNCADCGRPVVWMHNANWHFILACGCTLHVRQLDEDAPSVAFRYALYQDDIVFYTPIADPSRVDTRFQVYLVGYHCFLERAFPPPESATAYLARSFEAVPSVEFLGRRAYLQDRVIRPELDFRVLPHPPIRGIRLRSRTPVHR